MERHELRVGLRVEHAHLTHYTGTITAIHNRGRCSVKWSKQHSSPRPWTRPKRVCRADALNTNVIYQLAALARDTS